MKLSILACDMKSCILSSMGIFVFAVLSACAGTPSKVEVSRGLAQVQLLRILPFGDSNTYGYFPNGYRKVLSDLLLKKGIEFEYVGNEVDERDTSFANNHHEGHIGWGTDDLLKGREGATAIDSISRFHPDVILLMAGTNDLGWKKHSVAQTEDDFKRLLEKIRVLVPNARLVVSTLLPVVDIKANPRFYASDNHLNQEFNEWLKREVELRSKIDSNLFIVDIGGQFLIENSIDGIHANEKGYSEMAQVWMEGLSFLLPFRKQEIRK